MASHRAWWKNLTPLNPPWLGVTPGRPTHPFFLSMDFTTYKIVFNHCWFVNVGDKWYEMDRDMCGSYVTYYEYDENNTKRLEISVDTENIEGAYVEVWNEDGCEVETNWILNIEANGMSVCIQS
jgi:hypothetical protein